MYLCKCKPYEQATMKQAILFILFTLSALCGSAQEVLRFEPAIWNFGTIKEVDGPVSHTFVGRNSTDKPLIVLDVLSSCGCTVAKFSKKPILPGEQSQITVTYDPKDRPGSFHRQLYLYSPEHKELAMLTVQGEVEPRPKSVEERYPIDLGEGLRLSGTLCAFTYVYAGATMQSSIGCINHSKRPLRLALHASEQSGILTMSAPATLAPGEEATLNFCYENPLSAPRYGTLRDVIRLSVNGKTCKEKILVHGIGVDKRSKETKGGAAKAEISENILKFGTVNHDGGPQRGVIHLSNTGNGALVVRAIEPPQGIRVELKVGEQIAPNTTKSVAVEIDPSQLELGIYSAPLLLITNDPERPMRRIRITAIVEA